MNAEVAIKVINIDYDDPMGFSLETLVRFKNEVDFQRKLSYHPNVVRFIGTGLKATLCDATGHLVL
jgi:serine/threonine protein kinase